MKKCSSSESKKRRYHPRIAATADSTLETILGSVINLPLSYWRPGFFFVGADDNGLKKMTGNRFPEKLVTGKTHPVIALHPVSMNAGFGVCPCSSKIPFRQKRYRYIRKGCQLLHTRKVMDRNSYLIEHVRFNIPSSVASRLRFFGEVPESCIVNSDETQKE